MWHHKGEKGGSLRVVHQIITGNGLWLKRFFLLDILPLNLIEIGERIEICDYVVDSCMFFLWPPAMKRPQQASSSYVQDGSLPGWSGSVQGFFPQDGVHLCLSFHFNHATLFCLRLRRGLAQEICSVWSFSMPVFFFLFFFFPWHVIIDFLFGPPAE